MRGVGKNNMPKADAVAYLFWRVKSSGVSYRQLARHMGVSLDYICSFFDNDHNYGTAREGTIERFDRAISELGGDEHVSAAAQENGKADMVAFLLSRAGL